MANTIDKNTEIVSDRPDHNDGHSNHPPEEKKSNPVLTAILIVAALIILLLVGIVPKVIIDQQNAAAAKKQSDPRLHVQTVHAKPAPTTATVDLPGDIEAIRQSSVNARSTGYLKQWFVDIGDHVKQGQVMAVVEAPDQDQELAQARAQLANSQAAESQAQAGLIGMLGNLDQAKANYAKADASVAQAVQQVAQQQSDVAQAQEAEAQQKANLVQAEASRDLAKITAQRYENLVGQKAIAQQTADQEEVAYKTAEANVEALQASVAASAANVAAIQAGVAAARSNVTAYRDALNAAKSAVATAVANVSSSRANVVAAQANVSSSQANVAREAVLTNFDNVTAPFSGIVTARNVDNGDLINAGGSSGSTQADGSSVSGVTTAGSAASGGASGSGTSGTTTGGASSAGLFSVAELDKVRIYVNVPQEDIGSVYPGIPASILVHELPSKTFTGVITRTADSLDPSSRTLVAEVDLNNPGEILRPGMFADVQFTVKQPLGTLLIPDSALITNGSGTQVATVVEDDSGPKKSSTVHLANVSIGRDFGTVMQVLNGVTSKDTIIDNPPDGLKEGEKVVAAPEKTKKTAS